MERPAEDADPIRVKFRKTWNMNCTSLSEKENFWLQLQKAWDGISVKGLGK